MKLKIKNQNQLRLKNPKSIFIITKPENTNGTTISSYLANKWNNNPDDMPAIQSKLTPCTRANRAFKFLTT